MVKHAVSLDDKYTQDSGKIYISALQALARLPMEQRRRDQRMGRNTAGFISGYRGSPLGTYDAELWAAQKHLDENHIRFVPGVNEELAAAHMKGTQWTNHYPDAKYDGVFALWYGKHLGVERACEAIKQGNYDGTAKNGGVLIVCGDDMGGKSSITAAESEHVYIAAQVPLLYPATTQEIIEFGLAGWAMSRFAGLYVGLKTVTDTIEMTSVIDLDTVGGRDGDFVYPEVARPPEGLNAFKGDYLPLPQENRLVSYKLPAAKAFVRANGLDKLVIQGDKPVLGIVSAGKPYLDVCEAFRELGLDETRAAALGISVYKVGMVWPLEDEGARAFCEGKQEVLVVEEKRPVIEEQITRLMYHTEANLRPRVLGKKDEQGKVLVPEPGERSVNELVAVLTRRIRALGIADEALNQRMAELEARANNVVQLPTSGLMRTPYFCSGCPHNSSTKTVDGSMTFTGVGCYGLVPMVMPSRKTEWAAQMGAEGTLWVGMEHFLETDHAFQNLGDGTYFHSGILAIRSAIASGANVTYKLLYNDAVAMTGGQPVDGTITVEMMANQIYWEGVRPVIVVTDEPDKYPRDTHWPPGTEVRHRKELEATQRELQKKKGVSAIIYDQTCAAEKRRRRKRNLFPDPPKRVFINQDVCEGCGDCSVKSNCMSVQPVETALGRKRKIDQSSCNKDFSCLEGFCPSFVTVHGGKLRKSEKALDAAATAKLFAELPEPSQPGLDRPYNILLTGIGGTGVLTVGAILGMAAHVDDKAASVMDVTGMAQKGGSVLSNIRVGRSEKELFTARLWSKSADAIIGCDLVVTTGAMALHTFKPQETHIVVNDDVVPTAQFQANQKIDFSQESLINGLAQIVGRERVSEVAATEITTALMGDSIGTNIFMLGFALQKGVIPVSVGAVEEAIRLNGVAVQTNLDTLSWGRMAAHNPDLVKSYVGQLDEDRQKTLPKTADEIIAHRKQLLTDYQNAAYAESYLAEVEKVRDFEQKLDGGEELSRAVAHVLAKLMAYKDEYEVARLYSRKEYWDRLHAQFDGDFELELHLAPPLLAKRHPSTGELMKRPFKPWMFKAFEVLARFKNLRGSKLDIFGYTAERKMERQLIQDYRVLVAEVLRRTRADNKQKAVELLTLYDEVRGYGHIKEDNVKKVKAAEADMLRNLDTVVQVIDAAAV